jgi:hypothetical protein
VGSGQWAVGSGQWAVVGTLRSLATDECARLLELAPPEQSWEETTACAPTTSHLSVLVALCDGRVHRRSRWLLWGCGCGFNRACVVAMRE